MNKYMIFRSEQFSTHFGACCVITRSLLKHTDLNITEFLQYYFLKIAHLRVYNKTHPIKKQIKYVNNLLREHFNYS